MPEREDEKTEELFIEVLKGMGVYHENIRFHNVHRVPRERHIRSNQGGQTDKENQGILSQDSWFARKEI